MIYCTKPKNALIHVINRGGRNGYIVVKGFSHKKLFEYVVKKYLSAIEIVINLNHISYLYVKIADTWKLKDSWKSI